jgi:dienelactone hydrolase
MTMNRIVTALSVFCCLTGQAQAQSVDAGESRVLVESGGWRLVGDFVLPRSDAPVPAVLMLNKAAGDRRSYAGLASQLAARGIASLRIDLRGHGESTNLGEFMPGELQRDPLIWDAEVDVIAAHRSLISRPEIDDSRIAIVGASYSGEEMAEAGRQFVYARAYVAISPGSFSDSSIQAIDASGVPWLFVVSSHDRFLREITADVWSESRTAGLVIAPGTAHATDILATHEDMAERIATWLAHRLR